MAGAEPSVAIRPSSPAAPAYEADFYSWVMRQAELIGEGRFDEIDAVNIAEELRDLGRSEQRQLRNELARVLQHILKWDFQPEKRSPSWLHSIDIHRVHARQNLRENTGLKPRLPAIVGEAYELAVRYAVRDTRLPVKTFPAECPYDFETIMTREMRAAE